MTATFVEPIQPNGSPPKPTVTKDIWEKTPRMVITPSPEKNIPANIFTPASRSTSNSSKSARAGINFKTARIVLNLEPDKHCSDSVHTKFVAQDDTCCHVATLLLPSSCMNEKARANTSGNGMWTKILNEQHQIVAQWEHRNRNNRRAARRTTVFGPCQTQPIGTVLQNRKFLLEQRDNSTTDDSFMLGPISSLILMDTTFRDDESTFRNDDHLCIVQYSQVGCNGTPARACFHHNTDGVYRVELELPTDDSVCQERGLALLAFITFQTGEFNEKVRLLRGGGSLR